jgi:predicted secreted protein
VWDDKVRCPRHHYLYNPCTGENVFPAQSKDHTKLWKTKPGYLPIHPVQEHDGWIWIAPRPLPPPSSFDPSLEEEPVDAEVEDTEEDAEEEEEAVTEVVKMLQVQVGTTFELRLPVNPLPGHIWNVEVGPRLEMVEQRLLPVDPPRWQVRVSARNEGEDEVRCAFRQPWDVEPSERRRYVVRVVARPTAG